ncbi:hypothetical protein FIBSPDRAFT_956276 [Athelia psychrophila]|uniref:NADH:ubiquinone reductase (non-electrogenic) n=1 Tax=Athelia psychrophila TaxID=1759441 RepID=A0A166H5A5_9AGAM|nr:hypothetical protein FIBSPDRAFT_956276 [Fibularhizoctonia sp. CBS 109695]
MSPPLKYDYLAYAVGAEVQIFDIKDVNEHACLMNAALPGQVTDDGDMLLNMVVVGGGPTSIELSGELHDFLEGDLKSWYPEPAGKTRITPADALPFVLPMFSKQLIGYTESVFKECPQVHRGDALRDGGMGGGQQGTTDYAGSNGQAAEDADQQEGIAVDDHPQMTGADYSAFAIGGDCTSSIYAPTAQVASQQGTYIAPQFQQLAKKDLLAAQLARLQQGTESEQITKEKEALGGQLEELKLRSFHYSHQGSLAYIESNKAIADLPFFDRNFASGGVVTFLFWRSVYLSMLFSLHNRTLVATDWVKTKVLGRDVSRD